MLWRRRKKNKDIRREEKKIRQESKSSDSVREKFRPFMVILYVKPRELVKIYLKLIIECVKTHNLIDSRD